MKRRCSKEHVLAIPPPFKAWLTISNDPDHTQFSRWQELHNFLWCHLELPLGDSFFIEAFQEAYPQATLKTNPQMLDEKHFYDTLHTWGDYFNATKLFTRKDAVEAIDYLKQCRLNPLIWTDHANFPGNMRHNSRLGAVKKIHDAAGYVYDNPYYTLDLVDGLGVRYVWDGQLTSVIGQDVPLSRLAWYKQKSNSLIAACFWAFLDYLGNSFWKRIHSAQFSYRQQNNQQYFCHEFEDGRQMYCFSRFGNWVDADIDGIGELMNDRMVKSLIESQGTCILYTHLGKRKAERNNDSIHIPEATRRAFENLQDLYHQKEIMVSSTSKLLDYLVLRDHICINIPEKQIRFQEDGIRFKTLSEENMKGFIFGFSLPHANKFDVYIGSQKTNVQFESVEGQYYQLHF